MERRYECDLSAGIHHLRVNVITADPLRIEDLARERAKEYLRLVRKVGAATLDLRFLGYLDRGEVQGVFP